MLVIAGHSVSYCWLLQVIKQTISQLSVAAAEELAVRALQKNFVLLKLYLRNVGCTKTTIFHFD